MNETAKELYFVHTGPQDLAGKYLRMFWQPLYCAHELAPGRAVPIRILGEDLMFPSGRARLATNPFPTGSVSCVITMGTVPVAALAERVGIGPAVTMASTLRRTSSAVSSGYRSTFPSAYRHSVAMLCPST